MTSMKIAVRQMILGRQAACMCVSVENSHGTVHIMSTSIRVHLRGYMDLFIYYMNYQVVFGGQLIFEVDLYSGKCSIYVPCNLETSRSLQTAPCSLQTAQWPCSLQTARPPFQ